MVRDKTAAPVSRPSVLDFLLLLAGGALSLYLVQVNPLAAVAREGASGTAALVAFLPLAMRLPEGIILCWPLFALSQSLAKRTQGLTAVEWLWVLAWMGVASLTVLAVVRHFGWLPASVEAHAGLPLKFWYLILNPTMAVLGACLALMGLVGQREPPPWTQNLALALVLWPVLPLLGILALGRFA
jgi:hypothetical protein